MIKYFCDICGCEVDSERCLQEVRIKVEEEVYRTYKYSACNICREMIKEYIERLKGEKNDTTN